MKKLFVAIIVIVLVNVASAQIVGHYHLTEAGFSAGKGALTSGFDTRFDFSNDKSGILFVQANNDRATVNFGKKFGNFQFIESVGVFKNVPWTGPMLVYQVGSIDIISWNGIGFSKDREMKDPGYHPNFFFSFEGIGISFLKKNRVSASVMWFTQDRPDWFLAYKRTVPIGENSKLFGEITYSYLQQTPMFVIGYSMKMK